MTGEKKRKRKTAKAVQPSRTLEQLTLEAFAETGELSGLLILADWVEENDGSAEYAAQLREVAGDTFKADAVRFFMANAGSSYTPGKETREQGKFRGAFKLREAEEWFEESEPVDHNDPAPGDMRARWEQDAEYNPGDYDPRDMPAIVWVCILQHCDGDRWRTVESLGAITFAGDGWPDGQSYARVVVAELAAELMHNGR